MCIWHQQYIPFCILFSNLQCPDHTHSFTHLHLEAAQYNSSLIFWPLSSSWGLRALLRGTSCGDKRGMGNHCIFPNYIHPVDSGIDSATFQSKVCSYCHTIIFILNIHITFNHMCLIWCSSYYNACHVEVLLHVITYCNSLWFTASRQSAYGYICSCLGNGRLAIFTAVVFNSGTKGQSAGTCRRESALANENVIWGELAYWHEAWSRVKLSGERILTTGHSGPLHITVTLLLCLFYIMSPILPLMSLFSSYLSLFILLCVFFQFFSLSVVSYSAAHLILPAIWFYCFSFFPPFLKNMFPFPPSLPSSISLL